MCVRAQGADGSSVIIIVLVLILVTVFVVVILAVVYVTRLETQFRTVCVREK